MPVLAVFAILTVLTILAVFAVFSILSIGPVLTVFSVLAVMDLDGLSVTENEYPEGFSVIGDLIDSQKLLASLKSGDKLLKAGDVRVDTGEAFFHLFHPFLEIRNVLPDGAVVVRCRTRGNYQRCHKECFR